MANSDQDRRPNCWRRQQPRTDRHGREVSSRVQEVPQGQSRDISGVPKMLRQCHCSSLISFQRIYCAISIPFYHYRMPPVLPKIFGLNEGTSYERAKNLIDRIGHIIRNHSGIGVKTLKVDVRHCGKVITAQHLDIWLQATIRSGTLEISVELPQHYSPEYNLRCSHLSCAGSSLQSISLFSCAFQPTLRIGYLKSLKSVCLNLVHTTGEELGCIFSSTVSLGYIQLTSCNEITFLNIPSHLQALSTLKVFICTSL
ncbi:hypothetical protein C2845_PM18G06040 [Panicum miliaceum]|uniref:At1g61320/AtMIF1 LRR domain-containing protein n=1 Tax=Panicum miliaceum TaxID=4540 RepID=A0A3L6PNC3_PANMI|nr:hypothetical protein C2845_PM18G06040 [Panicum miliaceum]